jgi:acetyl esterase/lipase
MPRNQAAGVERHGARRWRFPVILTPTVLATALYWTASQSRGSPDDVPQPPTKSAPAAKVTLAEARRGFQTKLIRRENDGVAAPEPPAGLFRTVRYDAPSGRLAAYLTPDPRDGKKHCAILWIHGGNCNSIREWLWEDAPASNDQTAAAFRKAGIVMMFPSLRGGNDNPGVKEGFFGEVDDVLAAAEFLAKQAYVDPSRIYLGGHSTGGTLVLLVAECSGRFRVVFSFGPGANILGYDRKYLPFDTSSAREGELRSPGYWLHSITSPVFVFEGTAGKYSNLGQLQAMRQVSSNPAVHFLAVEGATHAGILAPASKLIATKILRDVGPTTNLTFTAEELSGLFAR